MMERKLVLKQGRSDNSLQKILQSVLKLLEKEYTEAEIYLGDCTHACYMDAYYDTDDQILRKSGESFKTRRGTEPGVKNVSKVIMRKANRDLKTWYDVEIPLRRMNFENAKCAMKSFFYEFDFGKLNSNPVLICNTHRTSFKIVISAEKYEISFSICFDNIKYIKGFKEKSDSIIEIKTAYHIPEIVENVLKSLEKEYSGYQMIYVSVYERALEVLKS